MPQRIRLGTVTNGTLDTLEGTIEIDNGDIYIVAENGDIRTDGNLTFEDAAADPSANGELQRNGADLKAFSGGAVRNLTSPTFESLTAERVTTNTVSDGDSGFHTEEVTLGDTETQNLNDLLGVDPTGVLIISKEGGNNAIAIFGMDGPNDNVYELHDPEGQFNNASGSGENRIYNDSGDYILENQEGTSIDYNLTFIGNVG